jgi:tight adherence protein B
MILLFLAFFIAAALLLFALAAPGAKEAHQTLSRLEKIRAPQSQASREGSLNLRKEETLSAIGWLDETLRKLGFGDKLKLVLYQADKNWTVGKLLLISALAACIAGTLVQLRTRAAVMSLIVAAVAASGPFLHVRWKRARRFDRMRLYLPDALDLMVASIRAGHSFSSAMGMAAKGSPEPIRKEFRQCFDEQNFGLELRFALTNLAHRVPIHDIRILVTAVLIQNETGGNLTEILEKVGYLIREDFRLQRQVKVHTAQGRLTGWILSLMPPILGFALYMVNPSAMSLLWTREAGRDMLYGSLTMTTIGALIIRRVIRIRV